VGSASGNISNTPLRSFTTPVGQFKLLCESEFAWTTYDNTTPGDAELFASMIDSSGHADYRHIPQGDTVTERYGAKFTGLSEGQSIEWSVSKNDRVAKMRVNLHRGGEFEPNKCVFNWELLVSG
jgi:hypothetical protein